MILQRVLYVYNALGLLIAFFLASKTTPNHMFYEYSKIMASLRFYRHVPFFWNVVFYSCFLVSFYGLFVIFGEVSTHLYVPQVNSFYMPRFTTQMRQLFKLLFDLKVHRSHKNVAILIRLLNCLLALVLWSFIKFYRTERELYHHLILAHQEKTDKEFLRKNCLKI